MDERMQTIPESDQSEPERTNRIESNFLKYAAFFFEWVYYLRKVILAIPVIYGSIRLAVLNSRQLNESVGFLLQADGSFGMQLSKALAVYAPLALTAGCLVMMFLSRKSLYAWVISVFTLALPVLILFSNQYPA